MRGKDRPLGHSVVRELQEVLTDGVHNLQKRRLSFVVSFCLCPSVYFEKAGHVRIEDISKYDVGTQGRLSDYPYGQLWRLFRFEGFIHLFNTSKFDDTGSFMCFEMVFNEIVAKEMLNEESWFYVVVC